MSIPPVDAPARMTMPMPAPIIIPPRIVQSIASFVREDSAGNEKPEQKGQDIEAQYERCDRRVEPVRRCEGQTGCAAGDDAGWKDKGDDRKGIQGVSKQNQENPEQIF